MPWKRRSLRWAGVGVGTTPGPGSTPGQSFFVDDGAIRRARRVLRTDTDAEAVRLAIERVLEMRTFWQFMTKSRGRLARGSLDLPVLVV